MAYVYRHIRVDKNQPFYIGVGGDGLGKYARAYEKKRRNSLWHKVVAKTSYEIEIVVDEVSSTTAFEKEKEFILLYGRINKKTGILTNMTDGGEGSWGQVPTEKQRESSRIRATGNKFCVGRVMGLETRAKLSEKAKLQKPNNNIPVVQYSKDGQYVNQFNSCTKAEDYFGTNMGNGVNVSQVCRGVYGRKSYKGFLWKYKKDVLDECGEVKKTIDPLKARFSKEEISFISSSKLSLVKLGEMFNTSGTTIFYIKKRQKINHE